MSTKIVLKSSDGESFEVEEAVAMKSQTIKHIIEDDCAKDEIPIPNVTSQILSKVIEYCKKHVEAETDANVGDKDVYGGNTEDEALKTWDASFVDVSQQILFDMILAANYLNISGLLDLTCKTVADMMKGKTPEQMREHFHIKNDYTKEEEDEVRRENAWAFE